MGSVGGASCACLQPRFAALQGPVTGLTLDQQLDRSVGDVAATLLAAGAVLLLPGPCSNSIHHKARLQTSDQHVNEIPWLNAGLLFRDPESR